MTTEKAKADARALQRHFWQMRAMGQTAAESQQLDAPKQQQMSALEQPRDEGQERK